MLIPALAAAFTLQHCGPIEGPPCVLATGFAAMIDEEDGRTRVILDDGDEVTLYSSTTWQHEADGEPIKMTGRPRRVRTCLTHGSYGKNYVMGEHSPRDTAFYDAVENFVAAASHGLPRTFDDVLVERGLSHESFATREAASRMLAKRGLPARRAIQRGMKSNDAEVRLRCELAMRAIVDGY